MEGVADERREEKEEAGCHRDPAVLGGVAEEGELIEVVEMTVDEVKRLLAEPEVNATPVALYGLMWFLAHKSL